MRPTIVFDIDGTLADNSQRVAKYLNRGETDWEAFHCEAGNDKPVTVLIDMLKAMCDQYTIVLLTSRPESKRSITVQWLSEHGVYFDKLFMRPDLDKRIDTDFKLDILKGCCHNVVCLVEDRKRNVDAFRARGYFVLQCAEGNF